MLQIKISLARVVENAKVQNSNKGKRRRKNSPTSTTPCLDLFCGLCGSLNNLFPRNRSKLASLRSSTTFTSKTQKYKIPMKEKRRRKNSPKIWPLPKKQIKVSFFTFIYYVHIIMLLGYMIIMSLSEKLLQNNWFHEKYQFSIFEKFRQNKIYYEILCDFFLPNFRSYAPELCYENWIHRWFWIFHSLFIDFSTLVFKNHIMVSCALGKILTFSAFTLQKYIESIGLVC